MRRSRIAHKAAQIARYQKYGAVSPGHTLKSKRKSKRRPCKGNFIYKVFL